MGKIVRILSVILILLLQIDNGFCQTQDNIMMNAWLELGGLKFTPTEKESSAGLNIALKFQINRLLATMQYHDYFDRELAKGGFELFTTRNHYHAGNMMTGITNKKCRIGHVSISSGLGIFWGEFGTLTGGRFTTLGWPIEAAASLNILPVLGVNLKFFCNVNSKHSLIGFGMDFQLGKLRDFRLNPARIHLHTVHTSL